LFVLQPRSLAANLLKGLLLSIFSSWLTLFLISQDFLHLLNMLPPQRTISSDRLK
jgi:hypothetical protein